MGSFRELTTWTFSIAWKIFVVLCHFVTQIDCTVTPSNNSSSTVGPTTANLTTVGAVSHMKPLKGIGLRAIYVVTVVSGIVIVYFVIRAVCSRRRQNRTRRYGILNSEGRDNMEMRPLSEGDDDDDDDDMTLFDMSKRRGKR